MDNATFIEHLTVVLKKTVSENIKLECLQVLVGVTGPDCYEVIRKNQDLIGILIKFLGGRNPKLAEQACLILINLSSEVNCVRALLYKECSACNRSGEYCVLCLDRDRAKGIIPVVIKLIIQKDCDVADGCCQLLCNLSRNSEHANFIMDSEFYEDVSVIDNLVDAFCDLKYNTAGQNLDYLGFFFSNLTQSVSGLQILCDHARRLLPYTGYETSVLRRQGIVGMLRNISFSEEKHDWLLKEGGLDILPALLLPLAGPEEFPDDEMDKLPIELQYLPETKQREADPDVRQMILETLLMLCNGKEGRVFMRDNNAYVILRELHKVETNLKVKLACENVVDILIRTEDEIGVDKLKDVPDVPDDLKTKFEAMDKDYVEDK